MYPFNEIYLYGLVVWVSWHINIHFYTKNQFYIKQFSLTWVQIFIVKNVFQFIQLTQTILIRPLHFDISINFMYSQLNVKTVLKKSI